MADYDKALRNRRFELGSIVYVITDTDQLPRLLYAIQIDLEGGLIYKVIQDITTSSHYADELSDEKNILI